MTAADVAIKYALAQVGKPYQWGGTGPDAYDCSGLVQQSYRAAGINLPRTSEMMLGTGQKIDAQYIAPGDLLFPDPGHVQIYIGQGNIVEAPSTGLKVRVVPVWGMNDPTYPLWTARRVTAPGAVAGTGTLTAQSVSAPGIVGDLTAGTGGLLGGLLGGNAASTVSGLLGLIVKLADAIKWIAKPANWLRVAEFLGGLLLVVIGLKAFGVSVPKMPASIGKLAQTAAAA